MQDDISLVLGVEGLSGFVNDMARADAATVKATTSMADGLENAAGAAKKAFNQDLKIPAVAGSVDKLKEELKDLEKQWGATGSAIERAKIGPQIAALEAEIANAEKSIPKATKSMGASIKEFASEYAAAFGAAAVGAVVAFGKASVDAFMEYETAVADLSAITGAAGAELKGLEADAKQMGIGIEGGAVAAVEGFKIIKSAMADLNGADLSKVTKESIALAQASGMEVPNAAKSLAAALNQFQAPAQDAARYINVLGAAAKFGAAEIPATTDALLEFGGVAAKAKFSIEESAAAIQTLAKFGIEGGEAGTALRNIGLAMTNIKGLPKEAIDGLKRTGVNFDIVSNAALPAAVRLKEFSKVMQDGVAAEKTFGKENIVAAQRLLENIPLFEQLTKQVTGTNVAYDQAATNNATLAHSFLEIKNQISNFMIEVGAAIAPVLREITEGFTPAWESAKQTIVAIYGPMVDLGKTLMGLAETLGITTGEGNMFVAIVDGIGVAFRLATLPMQAIIAAMQTLAEAVTWGVETFADIRDAVTGFTDRIPFATDALNVLMGVAKMTLAPILLLKDAWDLLFPAEQQSNASKMLQSISIEAYKVGHEMGATNAQMAEFAKTQSAAMYAGLSAAEATVKFRKELAHFLEMTKEIDNNAPDKPFKELESAAKGAGNAVKDVAKELEFFKSKDILGALGSTDALTNMQKLTQEAQNLHKSVTDISDKGMRASDLFGDGLNIDTPLQSASNKFTLFAATVGDTFKGLKEGIKANMVQIGADLAFGIGEAIAMGGSVGDVFKAAIREMAVQIPKMAGMALLNAAAFPANAPIALPLAAIGLGLLGLSGILSGLFKNADSKKAQQTQSLAQESGARAPSQGGQLGLSAFVDNSGLAAEFGASVAENMVGMRMGFSVNGRDFDGEIYAGNRREMGRRGK